MVPEPREASTDPPGSHVVLALKEGRADLLGLGAFWKRPEAISELSGSRLGAS